MVATFGPNAVDWENRADMNRLREQRLARLTAELERSELGALLSFDFANIRYMTATHIGTWAVDKLIRFALLPRGGKPIVWDFGSAARHHQLYNPWLDHTEGPPTPEGAARTGARAGISTLRGAFHPEAGIAADVADKVATVLREHGLADEPLGIDVAEMPVLAALTAAGISVTDGQQVFMEARRIKTRDEITLLSQACAMVDAAYDELYGFLRPGVRENECVGLVSKVLYDLGSEYVEGVNAISGERCSPHPHVYSDRLIRPGDPAFFDILHSYCGYRTCYYRTFAVGSASRAQRDAYARCREYMDQAIALVKPGVTTADIVSLWPRAAGVRVPQRDSRVRPAVRAWRRPVYLGKADLQSAGIPRPPRAAAGGHGVRSGDLLAGQRRLVRGPDRRRTHRHRRRLRADHEVPCRGAAGSRPQVLDRGRSTEHRAGKPVTSEHGGLPPR